MNSSDADSDSQSDIELSVVLPCLNEEDTIEVCIKKAYAAFEKLNIHGEVIISDNGSTDSSVTLAEAMGARVIREPRKGYGSALQAGIFAAKSNLVIMADSDDSYDLLEIPFFYEKLKGGYDFVQGCRYPSGGGRILPGAMPFSHRIIGNPFFSFLGRFWFNAPVNDIYCGFRAFRKDVFKNLDLRCLGMEFAVEMIVKASSANISITEVPVTLHPDGRVNSGPHLKTFLDGWKTLRFLLMVCPKWLFFIPGIILIASGVLGYLVSYPGFTIYDITFDAHTLLFSSLAIICGTQSLLFGVLSKTFALSEQILPPDRMSDMFVRFFRLETGVILGSTLLFIGLCFLAYSIYQWFAVSFGELDYGATMRVVIPGAMLTALGYQIILSSFLLGIFKVQRA